MSVRRFRASGLRFGFGLPVPPTVEVESDLVSRFSPSIRRSPSVGEWAESGVWAWSRYSRSLTTSAACRRNITASSWVICEIGTSLTAIILSPGLMRPSFRAGSRTRARTQCPRMDSSSLRRVNPSEPCCLVRMISNSCGKRDEREMLNRSS